MAKVQYGTGVTGLSGSIGGVTFQKNGSGNIARTRGIPARSSTAAQQRAHQTHSRRLQEWQALSGADKTTWQALASAHTKQNKYGVVKKLSAQNWYESVNTNLEQIGASMTTSAPLYVLPIPPTITTAYVLAGDLYFETGTVFNCSTDAIIVEATNITSRSSLSVRQMMKQIGVFNSGSNFLYDIQAFYQAVYGLTGAQIAAAHGFQIMIQIHSVNQVSGINSPISALIFYIP